MNREINIRLNANRAKAVHTGHKFASGDKGIVFRIAVDELDTTGTTAKIVFKRSNGTSVEAGITGTEGVYSYTTLGNEFAVVGPVTADVKFYENENRVSTCTFVFDVTADTLDGLGNGTAGYSDTLERMKKSMEQAEADILAEKDELENRAEEILQQMKETAENAEGDIEETEKKMADLSADLEALYQEYVDAFGSTGTFNPRGPYSETETYTVRDMVSYNDVSWICYRNCTGETPSKESDCWQYFAVGAEVYLDDIISGEQQVGDAKKLDGHGAEYFAPLEDLGGVKILTELPKGITDNSSMQELIDALPRNSILKARRVMTPLAPKNYTSLLISKDTTEYVIAFAKSQYDKFMYIGGTGTDNKWQGWTELNLANYLSLTGGILTGILYLGNKKKFISWHDNDVLLGVFDSESSTNESTRLQVGNATAFNLANALILSRFVGGIETKYQVLHTGNKPTGTYTGNGTARTITTGGVGGVVLIRQKGATNHIIVDASGYFGAVNGKVVFGSGVSLDASCNISLASDSSFNTSGVTYEYYVL